MTRWWAVLLVLGALEVSRGQMNLRHLASVLSTFSERSAGGGLTDLLARSRLIIVPKLEITSPNIPKDGGSFQVYSDIPIRLFGGASSAFSAADPARNGSVQQGSAEPQTPALSLPPDVFRNPTIFTSYGRGRQQRELDARTAGFHDLAQRLLDGLGMDGRSCLLRTVCALSARPLANNGLLGDLVNAAVEIPSTGDSTREQELRVARQLGLSGAPCSEAFTGCQNALIDKVAR